MELYADELRAGALVYIGNPNNPTGDTWTAGLVGGLAGRHPSSTFLVDEAYIEFAGVAAADKPGAEAWIAGVHKVSLAGLVKEHPNVVVTRTFSKAFGLAALRVGYVIAQPETIKQLRLILNPKALGCFQAQRLGPSWTRSLTTSLPPPGRSRGPGPLLANSGRLGGG